MKRKQDSRKLLNYEHHDYYGARGARTLIRKGKQVRREAIDRRGGRSRRRVTGARGNTVSFKKVCENHQQSETGIGRTVAFEREIVRVQKEGQAVSFREGQQAGCEMKWVQKGREFSPSKQARRRHQADCVSSLSMAKTSPSD